MGDIKVDDTPKIAGRYTHVISISCDGSCSVFLYCSINPNGFIEQEITGNTIKTGFKPHYGNGVYSGSWLAFGY